MKSKIRITNADGFVWLIVNDKAKEVFNSGLFEVYTVYPDDTESLCESIEEVNKSLENGLDLAVEVGHLRKLDSGLDLAVEK
jgi:hypothetical protein